MQNFLTKKAVILGDSITARWNSAGFAQLIAKTGLLSVSNSGLSGSSITQDSMNISSIPSFMDRVASMDTDVDLVAIWGGTNDWHFAHLNGKTKAESLANFELCLNNLCHALVLRYPFKRKVFITPIQRNYNQNNNDTFVGQEGLLDYVEIIIKTCGLYGIQVIDAFRNSGIETVNIPFLTDDGLHPNSAGYDLLGEYLGNEINKMALGSGLTDSLNSLQKVCEPCCILDGWSVVGDDIVVANNVPSRACLLFKEEFHTLEFTKNLALSYWIAVGGAINNYIAVCNDYSFRKAANMLPNQSPNFRLATDLPLLTPDVDFTGWTRIKIVRQAFNFTMYGLNPTTMLFEQLYPTIDINTLEMANLAQYWTNFLLGFSRDTTGASGILAEDVYLNGASILTYL